MERRFFTIGGSQTAQRLAEELVDHVKHGLTRAEQIREIAAIIDDAYKDFFSSTARFIAAAEVGSASPEEISKLRDSLREHLPFREGTGQTLL